jgi:hypothetical protein
MGPDESPAESSATEPFRVFISYKRDTEPDQSVASFLHQSLVSQGHSVFIDIEIPPGRDWEEVISSEITNCEFFVVLLTKASTVPGYVVAETVIAKDREDAVGRPKILPIRLAYDENLPLRLSGVIGHLQHFEWNDPGDNDDLLAAINRAITKATKPTGRRTSLLRGDHFIVTGSLWQSAGQRESLSGTTIVPVTTAQETTLAVTRANGPGLFGIRVLDTGALEVAIWKGAPYRAVRSEAGQFVRMLDGDSHSWCFVSHTPEAPLLLKRPDQRKDPVVISFDQDLVRVVWTITHERGTNRESFLIVAKDSAAR